MRSDIDEPDLYPPDAEELTPDAKQHRNRAAIGTALVVWGTSLLVQRALGIDLETFFLGVGLGALAGWSQHRRYVWFLVGSIATAIGIGDVITGPFDNAFGSTISLLLIAAGFGAVYARYPRRSPWAVPVAAVFVLIAVGSFGIALIGLVPAVLGRFLLPMLLIGGGGLLLARHSLPPKAVKVGLAGLAVTFVLVGATSVPDIDRDPIDLGDGPGPSASFEAPLPAVAGRTLELRAGSGNVELRRTSGPDGVVRALGGHGARHLAIEDGKNIVIDGGRAGGHAGGGSFRPFGPDEVLDYVLELPDGVILDIELESGSITGMVGGGSGSLRTETGNIDLEIEDGGGEGRADDGPYDLVTNTGTVRVDSKLLLDLDVDTEDGRITVDGEQHEGRFRSDPDVIAVEVEIDTETGDVEVDLPSGPSGPTPPSSPAAPTAPS